MDVYYFFVIIVAKLRRQLKLYSMIFYKTNQRICLWRTRFIYTLVLSARYIHFEWIDILLRIQSRMAICSTERAHKNAGQLQCVMGGNDSLAI